MSDALMDLHTHYKAVKARLNAGRIQPPSVVFEAPPTPPEPIPEITTVRVQTDSKMALDFLCSSETKASIVQILRAHDMVWGRAMGPKRTRPYLMVRVEIYMLLRDRGWSYPRIGRLCGKRDHTTIINSIRRYAKWKEGQWKTSEAI
jgi:Bacterial dnaA protein helix-turn-helix